MGSRLHRDEVEVSDDLVRDLVDHQFPEWNSLALKRVSSGGTDNVLFRLGVDLAVRVPRIAWAATQAETEMAVLPTLAASLPLRVPTPRALGEPGFGYPFRWLVSDWIDGRDAVADAIDSGQFAADLARFVMALHQVNDVGTRRGGRRSGPLADSDPDVQRALAHVGMPDAGRLRAVWEEALAANPWSDDPVWVHGDLLPGNLIVADGRLAGVIDWNSTGVGDPACDAMAAWSMSPAVRSAFRSALNIDDHTWRRAKGWVVEQAVLFIPYYRNTLPDMVAAAQRRLDAVLSEQD